MLLPILIIEFLKTLKTTKMKKKTFSLKTLIDSLALKMVIKYSKNSYNE